MLICWSQSKPPLERQSCRTGFPIRTHVDRNLFVYLPAMPCTSCHALPCHAHCTACAHCLHIAMPWKVCLAIPCHTQPAMHLPSMPCYACHAQPVFIAQVRLGICCSTRMCTIVHFTRSAILEWRKQSDTAEIHCPCTQKYNLEKSDSKDWHW